MRWQGATAVITGASRGVGAAVARLAAQRGARLGLVARDESALDQLRRDLPGSHVIAPADVRDRGQLHAALDRLQRELGPVDILVNNAGAGGYGPFDCSSLEEADALMQLNYLAPVAATHALLPGMLARGRGHIVTVGSISGRVPIPLEATYVAAKAAVLAFSDSLALEVGGRGVGVSVVNSGPVATSFFETRGHPYARRFPKQVPAERVARAVITAVERDRAEILVPRTLRVAIVAGAVFPRLARSGTARSFRRDVAAWGPRR